MLPLIINTIEEFVEIDRNAITEDTHFVRDLHLTSYDIVSIVGKLENDFGIEIPDRDIRDLETVGDVMEFIKKKAI